MNKKTLTFARPICKLMAVVGALLNNVVRKKSASFKRKVTLGQQVQNETLKKLLTRARDTQFGMAYGFARMLESDDIIRAFQQTVPIYTYETIYKEWWHKLLVGEERDVCWPGQVKFFGLTSGTSNDTSKRVPLTSDMIRAIRKVSIRQLLALADYDLPPRFFEKSVIMLGGSTSLNKISNYFEGDMSGIMTRRLPFWFNRFYKPGKPIAKVKDWSTKIDRMVKQAPNWDVAGISGNPAWVQILLENIIRKYGLNHIHEIWPNLKAFAHGGVSLEPYRKSLDKLLGEPIIYLETYLASEGFLAFQQEKDANMQLVLDNGIFFEFIPFDSMNFTADGEMVEHPQTLLLNEVEEDRDYAILISTCAGAWRYLIGDTIRFTDKSNAEMVITGRTKHFMSLCGEHLSVDNMLRGIQLVSERMGIDIKEFSVQGISYKGRFAHKWFLGIDGEGINPQEVSIQLDQALKSLNDDYAVERQAALKEVFVEILPNRIFYDFLKSIGKEGGQHKFPRVMNGLSKEWESFLTVYRTRPGIGN